MSTFSWCSFDKMYEFAVLPLVATAFYKSTQSRGVYLSHCTISLTA